MSEQKRILTELLVVLLTAFGIGLLANALYSDGLDLRYVPPSGDGDDDGSETEEQVKVRLRAEGFQVLEHADVVALYEDPIYQDEAYVFVDARNDSHYQKGHIPGAYQFDHYHMDRYVNEVIPACQGALQVIVYCYGKDCADSEITTRHLLNFGLDPSLVHVYVGGMNAWCEAGLPIETGVRSSGDLSECVR